MPFAPASPLTVHPPPRHPSQVSQLLAPLRHRLYPGPSSDLPEPCAARLTHNKFGLELNKEFWV